MAIIAEELFNGGTSGNTVTTATSPALTGTSNGSFTYTTESNEGSLAALCPTGAMGTLDITLGTSANDIYARAYFKRKAGTANIQFFHVSNTDPTVVAQVRWNAASNALQLRNGTTAVATSTYAWPIDDWVRIDWHVDRVGGTQEARLFYGANLAGDIASPSETLTGACSTGTAANVKLVQVGMNAVSSGASFIVDDYAVGDAWIGAYGAAGGGGGGGGGPYSYVINEWNGSAESIVTVEGIWNGTTVDPATLEGVWDGSAVQ